MSKQRYKEHDAAEYSMCGEYINDEIMTEKQSNFDSKDENKPRSGANGGKVAGMDHDGLLKDTR